MTDAARCKAPDCKRVGYFPGELCLEHRIMLCKCGQGKYDSARKARCQLCTKKLRSKGKTYAAEAVG
jgi:hypothetical protein